MALNYYKLSEKYKPENIGLETKILLIGESPPQNGTSYFYLPKVPIRKGSLSDTIFRHYFHNTIPPQTIQGHKRFLQDLQKNGIFLIDISDEPLRIRDKNYPNWINLSELNKLLKEIPNLRDKIWKRGIIINDENIMFLLARNKYKSTLKELFPKSQFCSWKKFRTSSE